MSARSSVRSVFERLRKRIAPFFARPPNAQGTLKAPTSVAHPRANFPALTSADLLDAKLFATRQDLIAALDVGRRGIIAEVGVGLGDFSHYLIDVLDPAQFVAIDIFQMHNGAQHEGRACAEIFGSSTHEEFYRARLQASRDRVLICRGLSHEMLRGFPDEHFDLIYIDAGHDYASVAGDGSIAAAKIKPHGVMVFNDYVLFQAPDAEPYGVVPAVNELVRAGGWKVVGFALQHHLFCDIALRKIT
jgi:hypothetical protein